MPKDVSSFCSVLSDGVCRLHRQSDYSDHITSDSDHGSDSDCIHDNDDRNAFLSCPVRKAWQV